MLLLVTLLLVVASAILLALGFVQSTLGFIYLSMVCAGVAGLALIVFARLARRRSMAQVGAPALERPERGPGEPRPEPSTTGAARVDDPPEPEPEPGPEPEVEERPGAEPRLGEAEDWTDWGEEVVFPIENYDRLRVAEILPLLSELEADQLREVRDRELAGKARTTVLDRIDNLTGVRSRPAAKKAGPAKPSARKAPAPGESKKSQ